MWKQLRDGIGEYILCIFAALVVLAFMYGCGAQQQVWRQGELPADWQDTFGNKNLSRLSYVQTQKINRYNDLIFGLDTKDAGSGELIHKPGFIERVTALEGLEDSITVLVTTQEIAANQIGETIALLTELARLVKGLEERIIELEEATKATSDIGVYDKGFFDTVPYRKFKED